MLQGDPVSQARPGRGNIAEPLKRPDGKVAHAEVTIGDSRVMLGEENAMAKASPSTLYVYVPDVDAAYQKAIKAGGESVAESTDMFYGDRCGP